MNLEPIIQSLEMASTILMIVEASLNDDSPPDGEDNQNDETYEEL